MESEVIQYKTESGRVGGLPSNCVAGRHHGLDLLRIVAMLLICSLHMENILGDAWNIPSVKQGIIWVEALGTIAVNLYALVTGYVCVTSSWKSVRYIRLWMQVVFYTMGYFVLHDVLCFSGVLAEPPLGWRAYAHHALQPVPLGNVYWYFTAYSALFLLMPFINPILRSWSRARHGALLVILLLVFPVGLLYEAGCFKNGVAHNAQWLFALYIAGAYVRLHPLRIPRRWLALGYAAGTGVTLGLFLWRFDPFANYFFPSVVLSSLCVFLLFAGMEIRHPLMVRGISLLAPLSFGVYLVHCHPVAMSGLARFFPAWFEQSGYNWGFYVLCCIVLYLICSAVDACRAKLFQWCRANAVADALDGMLRRLWQAVHTCLHQAVGSWLGEKPGRQK